MNAAESPGYDEFLRIDGTFARFPWLADAFVYLNAWSPGCVGSFFGGKYVHRATFDLHREPIEAWDFNAALHSLEPTDWLLERVDWRYRDTRLLVYGCWFIRPATFTY